MHMQESLLFLHAWSTLNKKKENSWDKSVASSKATLSQSTPPHRFLYFYCSVATPDPCQSTARYTGIELSFYTKPSAFDTCSFMICHLLTGYTSYIKLAGYISASVLLSLSLYLGGRCCLQPLTGLFAPQASLYLIPHINRFFSNANTFSLSGVSRQGFT